MLSKLRVFLSDDQGAVTVDWVVLTAGVVAFNIFLIFGMIEDGIEVNATYINNEASAAINAN